MLVLNTKLILKNNNTSYLYDTTGNNGTNVYGVDGNINYSDVVAVRVYTGTYTTIENPSTPEGGVFIRYTQYLKIAGEPEVINGKTFVDGSIFVPQFDDLSTAQPNNWETTGYYNYPFLNTWLPTAAQTPLEISVAQLGQKGDNIEDNEYLYGYDVYVNTHSSTFSAVTYTSYMVLTGSISYLGDTYYAGEVFTASDTSSIIIVSGSVCEMYAATSAYAALLYTITSDLNDLIELQIGKNNQDLVNITYGQISKIRLDIESLEYSSKTNNVSLFFSYQTILTIQARISQLLNP